MQIWKKPNKTFMEQKRTTPERITELQPNEIFVFGSNLEGMHGGGAALLASPTKKSPHYSSPLTT